VSREHKEVKEPRAQEVLRVLKELRVQLVLLEHRVRQEVREMLVQRVLKVVKERKVQEGLRVLKVR
jgi:hypothetical protein